MLERAALLETLAGLGIEDGQGRRAVKDAIAGQAH
jgi:hypothetical protein